MLLKVKFLQWSAGIPGVMLSAETAKEIGVDTHGRVSIRTISKYPQELSTFVDTITEGSLKKDEIIVSSETKARLGLREGQKIDINLARPPRSVDFIRRKLDGKKLSRKQIRMIIGDVVENNLSDPEVALFISAMHKQGMNLKEIVYLIKAILETGNLLNLRDKELADKHCIGGVAGNRTTPLVVSICSATGLKVPKTSSRAITSASGTADTIETLAPVEFKMQDLKKIISKTNAFMVWGGALGMVPADSKIIKIEKSLKIDPESQLLASIMSKKLAVGSKYILIDIPYGKNAKVTRQHAEKLKIKFEKIGKHFRRKIKVVLTDGKQPIGNGVGPALEIKDIINILNPKKIGPSDLQEKALFLSAELLELSKKAKKGEGRKLAEEMLNSGKAYEKFKEIIIAQGGKVVEPREAKYKHEILSRKTGKVKEISNSDINSLARVLGCPADKFSGVYLFKHVGNFVRKNEPLLTLYAESKPRLNEGIKYYQTKKPIRIE